MEANEIQKKLDEIEEQEVLTIDNVQRYCRHSKELKNTQSKKALMLLSFGCIRYIGKDEEFKSNHCFVCLPLNTDTEITDKDGKTYSKSPYNVDYNVSIYKIYKNQTGDFECNCQGWQTKHKRGEDVKDGVNCSHVLALFFAFKLKMFGRKEGAENKHI